MPVFATMGFLNNMIEELDADSDYDRRVVFAAFKRETIVTVAGKAAREVAHQFCDQVGSVSRRTQASY